MEPEREAIPGGGPCKCKGLGASNSTAYRRREVGLVDFGKRRGGKGKHVGKKRTWVGRCGGIEVCGRVQNSPELHFLAQTAVQKAFATTAGSREDYLF